MKTTKKLLTLVILSVIGTSSMAFCPINVPMQQMIQCMEMEQSQQRQQQQMNNMMQELEDIKANQRFAPRTCFRDYWGNIQCY